MCSFVAAACATTESPVGIEEPDPPRDTLLPVALTDMEGLTYKGFEGGLYPGGNEIPAAHLQAGLEAAGAIEPLDASGAPDPDGRYVLLSIGMSNATQEFCSGHSGYPCNPWTFIGQALEDPAVDDTHLVLVNGAASGQVALDWSWPGSFNYDRVLADHLVPRGLSEAQVRAVWVKVGNPLPAVALPASDADAYRLQRSLGDIARALRIRYPNVQLVFVSSRIYAGYATVPLNPEPFAYESGFSTKWIIEAQIRQEATGSIVDPLAGDLSIGGAAPWIGWGPYLWANGTQPNPDGLTWAREDLEVDGTHPSMTGEQKVGSALLSFFKSSPVTVGWFLR